MSNNQPLVDNMQVTIRPEDRLAATINQRKQAVSSWVQLREQLDTAETMLAADSEENMTDVLGKEIKQILQVLAPLQARLKVLNDKIVGLSLACEKPFREDLQRGFPNDLRDKVPDTCFGKENNGER